MKRVIAAAALLSTAIIFAFWASYTFTSKMDYLQGNLERLVAISENADKKTLSDETQKLVSQWDDISTLLHAIVLHEGIDELEKRITSLPYLIEYSDKEEMKKICVESISLIKNLKTCEKLSLENVL